MGQRSSQGSPRGRRGPDDRDGLVEVARAERQAIRRAIAASPTQAEHRVFLACLELTSSWTRLSDSTTATQIAASACVHPKTAAKALRRLASLGIIEFKPSRGRPGKNNYSIVGLPPAVSMTSGSGKGAPGDSNSAPARNGATSDSPSGKERERSSGSPPEKSLREDVSDGAPAASAKALVSHYVSEARRFDVTVPRDVRARLGRDVKRFLSEGFSDELIRHALTLLAEKGLGSGSLPSLLVDVQHPGRANGLRPLSHEEVVQHAMAWARGPGRGYADTPIDREAELVGWSERGLTDHELDEMRSIITTEGPLYRPSDSEPSPPKAKGLDGLPGPTRHSATVVRT